MNQIELLEQLKKVTKFEVNTIINGFVTAIKPNNPNAEGRKGAQLQFMYYINDEQKSVNVKIETSQEEMLEKFKGQNVLLKNVIVAKVGFDTYYRVEDISLITIDSKANIKGA
jgi:hypothetical protein